MTITTIGLDLAKNVFQVHGADAEGRPVLQRQLRRSEVRRFFANLAPCLIGMEACGGAHFWARELQTLGHEVRLMPPQYVRPYVKRSKNDSADAAAICEAVTRPTMRFVPVKSPEQQALLALHRMRELLVRQRSMLISAVRAHFAEFGLVAGQGVRNVSRLVAILGDAGDPRLPDLAREALSALVAQFRDIEHRIHALEHRIVAWHQANDVSRRLTTIPGVGALTASAIVATVGKAEQFRSARQFAAWLGLVPKQHSSGGKARLGGISKRGDVYLRRLLVHGARAVVGWRRRTRANPSPWISGLLARRPMNVVTVALANKNARIAWVLMTRNEVYRSTLARPAA